MDDGCPLFLHATANLDKQMEAAVVNGDLHTVRTLLTNGFHIDHKLHGCHGDTALHLATRHERADIIDELLDHGADPLTKNDLNVTPVSLATRPRDPTCLERLVTHADRLLDVGTLWLQVAGSVSLWTDASDPVVATLIRCSPDLAHVRHNVSNNLLYIARTAHMHTSLAVFVATGNKLSEQELGKLDPVKDKPFLDWVKKYRRTVHSLKHYCRLAVRRALFGHCNVFYGTRRLPLPKSMQDFICFREEESRLDSTIKFVGDVK